MAISPQCTYLAIGNHKGQLFVFSLEDGKIQERIDSESNAGIIGAVWDREWLQWIHWDVCLFGNDIILSNQI